MAFTRDKRAMERTGAAVLALCALVHPALAVAPPLACTDVIESGMAVSNVETFGFNGSGFVSEAYRPGMIVTPHSEGEGARIDAMPVPVTGLDEIYGYRVTNCRTREFMAFDTEDQNDALQLLATEFLRNKVQNRQQFSLSDVKRAAEAIYKGRDVKIMMLRETEQTCACAAFDDNLLQGN